MRRLLTALVAIAVLLLGPAAAAHASDVQVTEFPFTESVYNTCNDDLVLVNGTLVDSMKLVQGRNGGMTYEHRVSWKDVRTESSLGLSYQVDSGSVDAFRTSIRNGQQTTRSLFASWLRLEPVDGGPGRLRVVAVYAYRTDAQGVTRSLDRYWSSCS